jgi:pimeloyl-ACP methyl ester carboxylesterase
MILKHYANLSFDGDVRQTHYRKAGSGPPLLMLHPSPLSSAFLAPLIELFSSRVTAYAPDTPGYGASDPLPSPATDLSPYVDWLRRLLDSLGLASAGIYGSATGAQIAIQFARTYPEMTDFVVLDNAVHFSNEERRRITKDYFPDLAPRPDGSHLELAWEMSSRLYRQFPWFDDSEEARVSDAEPPLGLVHGTALSYLVAGEDYARAYRAAFDNEDARNLQAITRPARVLRWQGSILRRYADRLDDFEWPPNIRMVHCDATPESRYETLINIIAEMVAE